MGYEIKFLFRTDDPISVKGKDAIVKGLTEAGFKATPVADHDGELRRSTRQHQRGHQRPLGRLVLRLAVRLDLDADRARVDRPGQDPLVRDQLRGVRQQGRRQPDGRHPDAAAGPAGGRVERARQGDRRRSTSRCSRPTTPASPRPTDRRSRATSMTTRWACRPGRTSGSPSDLTGRLGRSADRRSHPGGGVRRSAVPHHPPPTTTARKQR